MLRMKSKSSSQRQMVKTRLRNKPSNGKKQSRKKAIEGVAYEEPSSMKPSIKEFTNVDGNYTSYSKHGFKANARILVEQDVNLVFKNLKFKVVGQPYDELLVTTDKRFKHYKAKEDLIILKDGLLFRNHYGETGNIKCYRILIPKQLIDEVHRSPHGELGTPELLEQLPMDRPLHCWERSTK